MTYTPCTTWANGIHPLTKTAKPKRIRVQKPRPDPVSYGQITAHDVTQYLRERPGSTSVDIGKAISGSSYNICRMLKRLTLSRTITRCREHEHGIWMYTANRIAPVNLNHSSLILEYIGAHPGCLASQVAQHTGVNDIFCKLKVLRKRGEITAKAKMAPDYGKPLNHYFLKEAA